MLRKYRQIREIWRLSFIRDTHILQILSNFFVVITESIRIVFENDTLLVILYSHFIGTARIGAGGIDWFA